MQHKEKYKEIKEIMRQVHEESKAERAAAEKLADKIIEKSEYLLHVEKADAAFDEACHRASEKIGMAPFPKYYFRQTNGLHNRPIYAMNTLLTDFLNIAKRYSHSELGNWKRDDKPRKPQFEEDPFILENRAEQAILSDSRFLPALLEELKQDDPALALYEEALQEIQDHQQKQDAALARRSERQLAIGVEACEKEAIQRFDEDKLTEDDQALCLLDLPLRYERVKDALYIAYQKTILRAMDTFFLEWRDEQLAIPSALPLLVRAMSYFLANCKLDDFVCATPKYISMHQIKKERLRYAGYALSKEIDGLLRSPYGKTDLDACYRQAWNPPCFRDYNYFYASKEDFFEILDADDSLDSTRELYKRRFDEVRELYEAYENKERQTQLFEFLYYGLFFYLSQPLAFSIHAADLPLIVIMGRQRRELQKEARKWSRDGRNFKINKTITLLDFFATRRDPKRQLLTESDIDLDLLWHLFDDLPTSAWEKTWCDKIEKPDGNYYDIAVYRRKEERRKKQAVAMLEYFPLSNTARVYLQRESKRFDLPLMDCASERGKQQLKATIQLIFFLLGDLAEWNSTLPCFSLYRDNEPHSDADFTALAIEDHPRRLWGRDAVLVLCSSTIEAYAQPKKAKEIMQSLCAWGEKKKELTDRKTGETITLCRDDDHFFGGWLSVMEQWWK